MIEREIRESLADKHKLELKLISEKNKLTKQLLNGLGDKIKNERNEPISIIKTNTFSFRIKKWFNNFLNKF